MTIATPRDTAAVAAGIGRWLGVRRDVDAVEVVRCVAADGGLSSDTLMVDVALTGRDGPGSESLVVRLAPTVGIFPAYDLAAQARVQKVVAEYGIPAAVPAAFEADPAWLGAPFLVMPAVRGYIPDALPLHDAWITESEAGAAKVSTALYDLLAAIHGVDWRAEGLDAAIPVRNLDAELAYWSEYLVWYADGASPARSLDDALAWCVAHRPAQDPGAVLLWGDVRLGNIVFDDDRRPAAVLDWEMTTIGAPEHDLAWYLTLAETQDALFRATVPGFLDRDAACARYESQSGRTLQSFEWFEVFAMLRSSAIMTRVSLLQERAGVTPLVAVAENPVLDLLTRRVEAAGR